MAVERLEPGRDFPIESGIVKEHLYRYELAARQLESVTEKSLIVLDVACGTGYGTEILSRVSSVKLVIGVDRDAEAIAYARAHHAATNIEYRLADVERWRWLPPCHVAVCLETLEHLEMPQRFVRKLKRATSMANVWERKIILSTPIVPTRHINPFHLHDFTAQQIEEWFAPWKPSYFEVQDGTYGIWVFEAPVEIVTA